MAADGSVIIEVDAKTVEAQKKLAALKKQIDSLEKNQTQAVSDEGAAAKSVLQTNEEILKQKEALAQAQEKINTLMQEKAALESQQQAGVQNQEAVNHAIEQYKSKIAEANELITNQANKISELMQALEKSKNELEKSEEESKRISEALENAKKEAGMLAAKLAQTGNQGRVITVSSDTKKAQSEIDKLNRKIESLNEKIRQAEAEKMPYLEQAQQLSVELDNAKAKLAEMQDAAKGQYTTDQINEQKETVNGLQYLWNKAENAVEKYNRKIEQATIQKNAAEEAAEKLSESLSEAGKSGSNAGNMISSAANEISRRIDKLSNRIIGLAKRVFFFTLISSALRNIRTYISDAIKQNDQAAVSFSRLSAAAQTLAQPILNVLIPVLTTLANVLTNVIALLASFFSMLGGKTLAQSAASAKALNNEKNALKGVGGAAKDASRQLASFDEINKLTESGGGGGGSSSDITPDFDAIANMETPKVLKDILKDVIAIGAGLIGWKIASNFTHSLKTLAGVAMVVAGALMLAFNAIDAWQNGVDWSNLAGMVGGLALACSGLYAVLGPIAAGIGLIVGGLALLVIGLRDANRNGMNWKNTLAMIAGLIATGLGIAIFTGSWIPLLIAGIGSALLAIVNFAGNGNKLIAGLKQGFSGLGKFIKGVFMGDWESAMEGLKEAGDGFKQAWDAIVDSIKNAWGAFTEWLKRKGEEAWNGIKMVWSTVANWFNTNVISPLKSRFKPFFDWLSSLAEGTWLIIQAVWIKVSGWFKDYVIDPVAEIFSFLWDEVKTTAAQVWEDIKTIFGPAVNFFNEYIIGPIKSLFKDLANGIIFYIESAINGIIRIINGFLVGFNKVATWAGTVVGKDFSGVGSLSYVSIPRLAQGAVIPPNREFLAVLGDQKSGTNIETPLETMVEAFRTVMQDYGMGNGQIVLSVNLDGREIARNTYKHLNQMQRARAR